MCPPDHVRVFRYRSSCDKKKSAVTPDDRPPDVSPDLLEAIEPAAQNVVAMRDDLIEGANFYIRVIAGIELPDPREVREWLERLSLHGHRSDEFRILGIPEELGDEVLSPAARRLAHGARVEPRAAAVRRRAGALRRCSPSEGAHGADGDPGGARAVGLTDGMDDDEITRALAESDLTDTLVEASMNGPLQYVEIAPRGRKLSSRRRAKALALLEEAPRGS